MQYYGYIIYSRHLDVYYVGQSEHVAVRLINPNSGISKFTSRANDWELKYVEVFENRELAAKRERKIKSKKSRKYIQCLIEKSKA
jgi:putative endonuclease